MKIKILAAGRIRDNYLSGTAAEYLKRLSGYGPVSVEETEELKAPQNISAADENIIREKESEFLEEKIKDRDFVIALDRRGRAMTSEEFASYLSELFASGKNGVVFLIGGSMGLSDKIRKKADFILSFSKMTFPHQLFRTILLEQLYRAFKILRREPYHK